MNHISELRAASACTVAVRSTHLATGLQSGRHRDDGKEAHMGDQGWYTDCEQGHAKERVSGKTEDEFVNNVKRHLGMQHKGMAMPDRGAILAMAKRG
jgi:hypothetical protein